MAERDERAADHGRHRVPKRSWFGGSPAGGSARSAARTPIRSDRAIACRRSAAASWCSAPTTIEHVVRERLKVYERQTKPLVEYYRGRPTFRMVNGAQAPERGLRRSSTRSIDDAGGGARRAMEAQG